MTRGLFDAFKAGQRSMTTLVVAILAMGLASCKSASPRMDMPLTP